MVAMQQISVGYVHRRKTTTTIPGVLLVLARQSCWINLQNAAEYREIRPW